MYFGVVAGVVQSSLCVHRLSYVHSMCRYANLNAEISLEKELRLACGARLPHGLYLAGHAA